MKHRQIWRIWFRHPLKKLSPEQIKRLSQEQKSKILEKWEGWVWTENVQNIDQQLLNIRDLPERIEIMVPHWIMDRLKEALNQYVKGQWLSSIVLCGAMVEFIANHLATTFRDKFPRGYHPPERLGKLLKALLKHGILSEEDFELLDEIRDHRDKHIHLKRLGQDKISLKTDNLKVVENLINYLSKSQVFELDFLQEVIRRIAQYWPKIPFKPGEDPNLIDVYWHGGKLAELLKLQIPTELPEKEIGVRVVEFVDEIFIKGSLIRLCSLQELAERGRKLVEAIQEHKPLPFRCLESYVTALYTWHGCISMAKLLRKTYVTPAGEAPYTSEMRRQGYNYLQKCWVAEEVKGNPWVRYGVSLAKLLEKKRGNPVVENWIPPDSPYWDC